MRDVFGFDAFRPLQAEIVNSILDKQDVLAIMPTGGGKSLCYQLPALLSDGLTVVVSPLISLMADQMAQLGQLGVPAAILNSAISFDAYRHNLQKIRQGAARLLYVAPETLLKPNLMELLTSIAVDCLAIDEAHCISFWGHDFRPEYRQLQQVRSRFPHAACAAFTATATPRVREDIKACLEFSDAREFIASFDRANLFLDVQPKNDTWAQVVRFIDQFPQESGIIYCFSRKQVDRLYQDLATAGYSVRPYHAGLPDAERAENQMRFIRDDIKIMVATIAFGMGIDKPNIRFVLHHDLPKTLEHYYQEIGRAGRDGLPAHCRLLLGYGDIRKIRYFIDQSPNAQEKRIAQIHLGALLSYAETAECRRIPILSYFGQQAEKENCGMCDNCRSEKQPREDVTIPAQKLMSCIKRTGERFGANHVIDVLRGSRAKKVLKFGHDRLSTYGIGMEFSKKRWFDLSRHLLHAGYVKQDDQYGGLMLTEKGWEVLRGKQTVQARLAPEVAPDGPETMADLPHDSDLFQRLRALRKSLADQSNVPPYVVFPDKTLIDMATYFPQSEATLAHIHGVGAVKLENYGPAFLAEISAYCGQHGIDEIIPTVVRPRPRPSSGNNRCHEVGRAFAAGKSVPELMDLYQVKESTILRHLLDYLKEGRTLDATRLEPIIQVPPDVKQAVLSAFDTHGPWQLRPVFELLQERVSYDDLHRLRVYYVCLNGVGAPG